MAGARIQLKRATASSWTSNNPVLYAGEIGLETDTNKFKIGDGTTAYNSLPYFNGNLTGSSLNDLADVTITSAANGDFLRWNGTAWVNDAVNLSTDTIGSYVESLVAGTGVSLTNNSGEAATPTIAIGQNVSTTASVTFAHVSASVTGNVVGDLTGNADTATTLETARIIELSGDVTGSASFDGSSNINISVTSNPDSITLGTDTTGNYLVDLAGGTGVTINHTPGEGSTASVSIGQDVSTTASVTFDQVTVNGQTNVGGHIIPDTTEAYDLGSASARFRDIYLSGTTIDLGGATITSDGTDISFSGGINVDGSANFVGDLTGNADTASTLETARAISLAGDLSGSVSFDGSGDVTLTATIGANSVALGTDTTGNFVNDIVAGTGVTVTHTPGEGSSASVAIGQDVATTASVTFVHVAADLTGDVTGNVTGDLTGNADTATTLETARAISLGGDLSGSVSFDGSADVTITATVQPNSVALGTDTTGNYVNDITAGTGVTVTHTPAEGSSPTIAIGQAVGTSSSVTFAAVTAPLVGNASTASTLQTARAISLAGDLSGSASFNGSQDVSITATVQPNSVDLGTDTTGNYVSYLQSGTGVIITGAAPAEGGTPTIAIGQAVGTSSNVTFGSVSVTASATIGTNLTVNGDLTVNGTTTTVNTETINLADNIILLNSNETSTPSQNAGIEIERGTSANVAIRWNETTDSWEITEDGTTYKNIAVGQDVETTSSVTFASVTAPLTGNASTATALETSRTIELQGDVTGSASFNGTANAVITASIAANSVALGTDTTGDYVSGLVAGTGITLTNNSGESATPTVAVTANTYDAYGAASSAASGAASALASHESDTTNIHGIADTSLLVTTTGSQTLTNKTITSPSGLVKGDVGLGNVDNTSDANKPISTATQSALDLKAPLASPTFTGTVTLPDNTVALGTKTTGDYVASLVAGTGITLTNNSGETSTPTIAVTANTYDAYGAASSAASNAASALSSHESDTTNIHGIADTSLLVTTTGTQTLTNKTITSPSGLVKGDVGLGNVDNTSDANKPVSTATQSALDLKAPLASPTFTGTVTLPDNTVALGTKTTGDYVASLVAGTGVTLTNNSGETATPTIAIGQAVATNSNVTFNDVTVSGNLTVSGSTTTVNTETINLADNVIVLNSNATGAPTENAGLEIERGSSTNVQIRWNETSDKWEITEDGTTYYDIATTFYVDGQSITALDEIGDVNITSAASGDFLKWNGTAWVNDPINLGTDTTGNYVSDVTAGTGVTVTHTPSEGSSPTIAIGQSVATSASPQFAALEVGNASDTTITRAAAGRIAVEGVNVVTTSSTDTLTNKTLTSPSIGNATLTGTLTANGSAGTSGYFLKTTGTGVEWASIPTINYLDDIGNVSASAPADGDVLTYNTTASAWVSASASGGASSLDDLSDVDIFSPQSDEVLFYDGSSWVNGKVKIGTLYDVNVGLANAGDLLTYNVVTDGWEPVSRSTVVDTRDIEIRMYMEVI